MTSPHITMSSLLTAAAIITRQSVADIKSKSRFKKLVTIRAGIVFVARSQRKTMSYPEIGRRMGGRDHSTIINAMRMAQDLIKRDEKFARFVVKLEKIAADIPPLSTAEEASVRLMVERIEKPRAPQPESIVRKPIPLPNSTILRRLNADERDDLIARTNRENAEIANINFMAAMRAALAERSAA